MQKYDVIIVGGGVSGLSCAITLGSAKSKLDIAANKRILIIDAGASHLKMAQLYNVPGIAEGTKGPELLASLAQKAQSYDNVTIMQGTVKSIDGTFGDFKISTESAESFMAEIIVLVNGMQTIAMDGIGAAVVENIRAPRPNMVMIENNNGIISKGKYVTGCAAGASSMFATAAGYGVQTATDIISSWVGKYTVIHDVLAKN